MRSWESVRPAPGERARRARGRGGGTRRSLEGAQKEPRRKWCRRADRRAAGKKLAAGSGGRVELCELAGRDTDVVIREEVVPRFWETIEDDLVEVF
jgi:hypothetical protein